MTRKERVYGQHTEN